MRVPLYVYVCAVAVAMSVPVLLWSVAATDQVAEVVRANLGRRRESAADVREAQLTRSAGERLLAPLVAGLGRTARRFMPSSFVEALEHRIAVAGMTGRWPVERVLAVKVVLVTAGFLVGLMYFAGTPTAGGILIGGLVPVVTWQLPELLLGRRAKQRQQLIQHKLPDTLDEITVSVEAGLGFEAAMAEAGRSGSGPFAEELIRTLQDIQIGVPRAQALTDLVSRTEVSDLRHFVIAVRQAEQYGVPIAQVLRVQSKEMRERRRQRAEERAMKMPVKILIPTVFFILPALFIVILGPAVLRLADSFGR